MSVYNCQKYLDETIKSILNQTFKDFEFIIINDCSTDDSLNIIKKYQESDDRIKLINNEKNIGLTKSLNKGINLVQGQYIARQDAGDISFPDRLAKQYEFLEKNKNIFLTGTNFDYIDKNNSLINFKHDKPFFDLNLIKKNLPKSNCFVHTSIMFRNENTYYREKFYYGQDYDLYLNLLSTGKKMCNLENKLVLWRMDASALSFANREKQTLFGLKAKEFYKQRVLYGKDKYDDFDPNTILLMQTKKQANEMFLEDKIKILLQNANYSKAKDIYYQQYCKLKRTNWINKKILYIFVNAPIIYKIYRKSTYNDKIER